MKNKLSFPLIVNYVNLISILCLLYLFMYIEFRFERIALFAFFTSYIVEIFTDKKLQNFKFDKTAIYFLLMIFFFILAFLYMPFEKSNEFRIALIERRLPLLGFGIVGLLGVNHLFKLKYFLYTIIFTAIVSIIYIFAQINLTEFISQPNRSDIFTATRIQYVNSHMIFNFYLNTAIISILYLLKKNWTKMLVWKHGLYFATLTFIVAILSLTEGRSGFIAGLLIILAFIFFEIVSRRKLYGIVFAFILPLIFVFVISNQRRMTDQMLKTEPRKFLWQSGLNIFIEKPVFGMGLSDTKAAFDIERIKNQHEAYKLYSANLKHIDCHNQYIQTLMEYGIFGFIILLLLIFYPAFITDKRRRLFALFAIALCAFQSVFDMFITGPFSLIFVLLMIMILRTKIESTDFENVEVEAINTSAENK